MRALPLLLLLAAGPALAAGASDDPPAPPPPEEAAPPAPLPMLGMRLTGGLPQGGALSLVVRPTRSVRIEAGPAWNSLGWGAQLGVGYQPFQGPLTPVLDLGYGHYAAADVSARFPNAAPELQPLLKNIGYDYLSGLVSLELGSPRGLSFSIGAGLAYLWTSVPASVTVTQNAGTAQQTTVTFDHPAFRAVIPTLKVGVLTYF
jgi:hypothetical protein